jgi:hypothetical protein
MNTQERLDLRRQLSIVKSMLREIDFCTGQAQTIIYDIENKLMDREDDELWKLIGNQSVALEA